MVHLLYPSPPYHEKVFSVCMSTIAAINFLAFRLAGLTFGTDRPYYFLYHTSGLVAMDRLFGVCKYSSGSLNLLGHS
jgi:hypothetical protein